MDARLESFLEALNRASNTDFPVKNYVAKLTAAGLTTPVGTLISGSLSSTASMTNAVFNSVDCSSDVGQLLASAAARGLGNAQDSFGFHHRVDKDVALQLSKTSLANMMPRLYGDFLVGYEPQSLTRVRQSRSLLTERQQENCRTPIKTLVLLPRTLILSRPIRPRSRTRVGQFHCLRSFMMPGEVATLSLPWVLTIFLDFILLQLIGQSASVNSFPNYFLNIFFVNEYFQNDGDFPVHVALPDRGSASGFLGLVEDYHKSLAASRPDDESNQSLGYGQRLANVISAVSHIYAPDRRLDHEIHALAGALFPSVGATESEPVASIKAYMANEASETLYSMGHRMWTAWDNEVQTFTDTMKILSSKAEPEKTIESHDNGYYVFQTEYGRAVAGLISYCRQTPSYETLFTSGAPDLSDRSSKRDGWNSNQQHWYDGGGCFVAGTQIMTLPGQSVPIERIEEGLTILTRADSNQFGTASDERVVIPLDGSEVTLFGFNDEDPFFTPNHVFFTTGGLRALDPVGAMRENAHVEVGHLQVGDVLLRTLDGHTYSAIPVESLTYQKTSEKYVYGVHLREGMRSYHANGYLVYLNYPEITLASIRKAMSTLGQDEQMRALLSLQELRPLLERFGGQAVFDAFHKQLADSASRPHLSVNLSPKQKRTLLDADISFDVVPKRTSDRPLPSLALHRGLLQVDGQSCNQYSLTSSCISWTRWVENQELWEHGCCAILPDMAGGGGVIIFSDNEVLDKMDWNGAIQVSCHARHHNPEPRSRAHSSIMAVRAVEISNVKRSVSQGMAQMANTTTIQAVSTPAAEPLIQTFDLR